MTRSDDQTPEQREKQALELRQLAVLLLDAAEALEQGDIGPAQQALSDAMRLLSEEHPTALPTPEHWS